MTPPVRIIDMKAPPDAVEQSDRLAQEVAPFFIGIHPAVVGCVLADLHAMMLAGMTALNPELNEMVDGHLETHVKAVRELMVEYAANLREEVKQ